MKLSEELDKMSEISCDNGTTELISSLAERARELEEIVKAVAHIGVDWGYGKFELNQEHIDKARKLYEGGE